MRMKWLALVVVLSQGCTQNEGSGDDDTKDTGTPTVDSRVTEPDSTISSSLQPVYASGPRLKRRIITGSDGSKDFAGWYDSQLGVNCAWGVAEDGSKRCLPDAYDGLFGRMYSNFGCTDLLAFVRDPVPSCVTGVIIQRNGGPAKQQCKGGQPGQRNTEATNSYFFLRVNAGAPFTGTTYNKRPDGTCQTFVPTFSGQVFSAEEIPSAMLVEAVETVE